MTAVPKGTIASAVSLAVYTKWPTSNITYTFFAGSLPAYYAGRSVLYDNGSTGAKPLYTTFFDSAGLNVDERAWVSHTLASFAAVSQLTFSEDTTGANADLAFGAFLPAYVPVFVDPKTGATSTAAAYTTNGYNPDPIAGDVWLASGGRTPAPAFHPEYGYHSITHEIGHALGLKHTKDPDGTPPTPALTGTEDTNSYSNMSYNPTVNGGRFATDLQIYDIAAIQILYGRNDDYRPLDDNYAWYDFVEPTPGGVDVRNRYWSIWDAGGKDGIIAKADAPNANLADAAYIDLRPGYFSSLGNFTDVIVVGGHVDRLGNQNVSIAFGSYIENATGTDFSDAIVGNNFTNEIHGEDGDDLILGSGAAVSLANARATDLGLVGGTGITDTDAGDYSKIVLGGSQAVVVDDEASADLLFGGDGDDILVSAAGNAELDGGAGNDKLMAGGGGDKLYGGADNDALWGGAGDDMLEGDAGADKIYGGADDDTINGGAGDDDIWGGEAGTEINPSGELDKVDYSSGTAGITISFDGSGGTAPILTVNDGLGGSDKLHSIEIIKGTILEDKFTFKGAIPVGYNLTIDANGGQPSGIKDVIDAAGSTDLAGMKIIIAPNSGSGFITSRSGSGGTITLMNFHTDITGSDFSDAITDESDDEHSIDGGAGDDTITVAGSNATVDGGAGNDLIRLKSAAATIEFGAGGGHDVVEFDGDGTYNLALQNLNPEDVEFIEGGRYIYNQHVPGIDYDSPEGFWAQFLTIKVLGTGETITFLENGRNIGPDGSGSAAGYNKGKTAYDDMPSEGKLDSITFANGEIYNQDDIWNGINKYEYWSYSYEAGANKSTDEEGIGYHSPESYLDYVNRTYLQAAPIDVPPAAPAGALSGTSGADNIKPGYGDDTVTGGAGDDAIAESPGDDTYFWRLGDGNDVISGSGSNDGFNTLKLEAEISAADLEFAVTEDGGGLILTFAGQDGSVTLADALVGEGLGVDRIEFADGSIMSRAALLTAAQDAIASAQTVVAGTSDADLLFPERGNFVLTAGGGDDLVFTSGSGSGTFSFASTDGHDKILGTGTRNDVLNLTDADPGDIQLTRQGDDLIVTLTSTGASVTVNGQFAGEDSGEIHGLGAITFAGGSAWNRGDIRAAVEGIFDNHAPVAQTSAVSTVEGKAIVRGALSVTDPDLGDTLRFTSDARIDGLFLSSDGSWSFDPSSPSYRYLSAGQSLTLTKDYFVTDLAGATASSTLTITLTGTNDLPVVTQPLTNHRVAEGGAFSYEVSGAFSDPDSALTLSAALADGNALPSWLSFVGGEFTGTVPVGTSGVYDVVVKASDGAFAATSGFLLHAGNGNQAPVIETPLPDATGNIEVPIDLAIPTGNFSDIEGDALAFSAALADGSALPGWLSFSDNHLVGTPPADAAGDYAIKVTASDGEASTSSTLTLSISATRIVNGTRGDDMIVLPQSNFIATPGWGSDTLEVSGDGAGTILFSKIDGYDVLDNPGSGYSRDDTLYLTDILPGEVTLNRYGDYMEVIVNATGNSFGISEQFWTNDQNERKGISYIKFADGTIWDRAYFASEAGVIRGDSGNNVLIGSSVDDILVGGAGNDTVTGGGGDDVYRFAAGDGQDIVNDYGNGSGGSGGADSIELASGILPADVTVTQANNGANLVLTFAGSSDRITISSAILYEQYRIEQVRFADGTSWSYADLLAKSTTPTTGNDVFYGDEAGQTLQGGAGNDRLFGRLGDDTLIGGTGNDTLNGAAGSDTYIFGLGDGNDVIDDVRNLTSTNTLQLGTGIDPGDTIVSTSASGLDIVIGFAGSTDTVNISYMAISSGNGIDRIRFDDGTVWNHDDIMAALPSLRTATDAMQRSAEPDEPLENGGQSLSDAMLAFEGDFTPGRMAKMPVTSLPAFEAPGALSRLSGRDAARLAESIASFSPTSAFAVHGPDRGEGGDNAFLFTEPRRVTMTPYI